MAKTLAIVLGIVYVAVGVLGFVGTEVAGTSGFVAADGLYSALSVLVGVALLATAFFAAGGVRAANLAIGAVLALLAVAGFIAIPAGGEMLGMLMNEANLWLNLVAGVLLVGSGLMERERTARFAHSM